MNGAQFGVFTLIQIVIVIMLWNIMGDLGDMTKATKNLNSNAATFFNDMDKRSGPPWPVVIRPYR